MRPVVDRLEEQYDNEVKFVYLNALEDGEDAFKASNFRGHPALLIIQPDGKEVWRFQGLPTYQVMEAQILDALQ